ncbi:MAG TPA: hypothetical protein PLL32_05690, partial [Anaeromyxobacteraceae bacterium]|nr:hypothetical protein [Anaeromyxobacteraceae bacterium]
AIARGGIVDEARALAALPGGLPARLPIGYADAAARARGEIDDAELERRIAVAHRRYARRQVIWLRREQDVEWVRPPVDVPALADDLARALRTAP